jgi:hypothetical protein
VTSNHAGQRNRRIRIRRRWSSHTKRYGSGGTGGSGAVSLYGDSSTTEVYATTVPAHRERSASDARTIEAVRWSCVLFLLAGCDSFYGVRGHVADCTDHRPLSGVLLHLESHGKRGNEVSAADGSYEVLLNDPEGDGPSQLTVAKPGFRTVTHDVSNPHVVQDVCLQPEPPATH